MAATLPVSMIPDYLILNIMKDYFLTCCNVAMNNLFVYANRLLYLLAGIDLILAVLLNLDDADHMKTLIIKTLKYGIFIYLVTNYREILNVFIQGFQFFGKIAGKNLPMSNPITDMIITNPAAIGTYGIYLIKNALPGLTEYGASGSLDTQALFKNGILFLIAGSYALIGIQMFVLIVEFYLVGALSMILVPFGVNKYTSFLCQGVVRALFTIGVKLMVMMFIIAMVVPILLILNLVESAKLDTCMYTLLASVAITYLTLHAPNVAMTIMSGTPMMNATGLAGVGTMAARGPGMVKEMFGKNGETLAKGNSGDYARHSSNRFARAVMSYDSNSAGNESSSYPKISAGGVSDKIDKTA